MSGQFADRLNPAHRTFHGYAGAEPIYCNETADVVVDQFEGDTGKVRIESGAGRARMTVDEAVAMAYAILRRFRPHTGVPPAGDYAQTLRAAVLEAEEHAADHPDDQRAQSYAMGLRVAAGLYGLPEGVDPATRARTTVAGRVLTDADIEVLAAEAEAGYDPAQLRPRHRPVRAVAELHRPAAGEPDNGVIAVFAHPHDHRPESVYQRSDETADESGYARDDDDRLTLQRWYEATEFPEAPSRWDDLAEGHIGPIFVFRLPKPAPETTEQHQP